MTRISAQQNSCLLQCHLSAAISCIPSPSSRHQVCHIALIALSIFLLSCIFNYFINATDFCNLLQIHTAMTSHQVTVHVSAAYNTVIEFCAQLDNKQLLRQFCFLFCSQYNHQLKLYHRTAETVVQKWLSSVLSPMPVRYIISNIHAQLHNVQ